jgi:Spy/CpxP family protein refolding chaperone
MKTWMNPWIKRSLFGLIGAGLIAGSLSGCGHAGRHGDWRAMSDADITKLRERMIDRAGRELSLDEAQKAKLGALADAVKAQRDALRGPQADGQAADPRAAFQALIAGNTFDRSGAQALVNAKTGAVSEKSPAVVAAAGDFFDSLKPEQQQKLRDWLAKRGGRGERQGWLRG